jgi:ADP-ribosylglycohydrolase
MRAYGTHRQPAGTWSDDGALLLCSVESLVEKGFDTGDMGRRFLKWHDHGLWTANGDVFDIGVATSQALMRIRRGVPAEEAGGTDDYSNGNGSLMRILPVVLYIAGNDIETMADRVFRASAVTHAHSRAQMACVFFGLMVRFIAGGLPKNEALRETVREFQHRYDGHPEIFPFHPLLKSDIGAFSEDDIRSGGYVMETLRAAIWCLLTTDDFAACVLKAVNLGGDTDTTACVAGGLAGVLYGEAGIPEEWRAALPRQGDLRGLFDCFLQIAAQQESAIPDVQAAQPVEFAQFSQPNKTTRSIQSAPPHTAIPEGSQPLAGD